MATAPTSPTRSLTRLRGAVGRLRTRKARAGEQTAANIDPRAVAADPEGFRRNLEGARAQETQRPGSTFLSSAGPQPVPTNGKTTTGAKLKEGATGPDVGGVAKPAPTGREGMEFIGEQAGEMVYRDPATGRTHRFPRQADTAPGPRGFEGEIDPETGQATAPDIGEYGAQGIDTLQDLAATEVAESEESLQEAEAATTGREAETETQLAEGRERLDKTVEAVDDIAAAAKQDASDLPQRVSSDLEGIADKYKETTDIDIDRIEGLGREAVGMAMEGKNAAAQAAVAAQQQALRAAEARINADPNIPAGRKAALLAQLRVNGSMQIATTIGANIKDFTQLQTGAMVNTMNAVASASTARNQSLAALGGAEMQAVAGAHMKVADISAGFDERRIDARQQADSIRFNYDHLTANYRDAKDGTSLALLDANNYVSQLPYDFQTNHFAIGRDILGTDFATKLQAEGYNNLQEALDDGQEWARSAMMSQLFMQMIPGPWGAMLGGAAMLFGGGLE